MKLKPVLVLESVPERFLGQPLLTILSVGNHNGPITILELMLVQDLIPNLIY